MLCPVLRVKKAGKSTAVWGIPLAVFTTLLADVFPVFLRDLAKAELVQSCSPRAILPAAQTHGSKMPETVRHVYIFMNSNIV